MPRAIAIDRVSWHPERALQRAGVGARLAGERAGLRVLERADGMVPLDTGALRDSALLLVEGDEVAIGYRAEHGIYVHAHPEWSFQNGREARWLEDGLEQEAPSLGAEYAGAIRTAWGG